MKSIVIKIDITGTVNGFLDILKQVLIHKHVKGLLVLACDANAFCPESVNEILKNVPIPLFGGIFPQIIHGQEALSKGTIILGLSATLNVQVIPSLSDPAVDYDIAIDEKIPDIGSSKTMFVLVDGFSKRISSLIDSLFNIFGLEVNYIGGGAGSLSFKQKPCLFTNEGLIEDSAILVMADMESGVGVSHGWNRISGPYRVTESDHNSIISLDWQPAFSVYRESVEQATGRKFSDTSFFELAKGYPFGIKRLDGERVVRDPIMLRQDGAIVCVGEVPSESYVDILTGDVASMVNAAQEALALSQEAYRGATEQKIILFIDCISRVLFMEDKFKREILAVHQKDIPLIGALTIGEIANSGRDYLEFYNKTAVVGILEA